MDKIQIPARVVDGDFAGWLREAMARRHMSARMVGLRTGINHSTITRLLGGDREPTLTTLIAILTLFGETPTNGALVGDADEPEMADLSLV